VVRGGPREFEYGEHWRRRFRFEVPVRCPGVWRRADVRAALADGLGFLTGDHYEFGFVPHPNPLPLGAYMTDGLPFDSPSDWEEVVLFSGGLDSLAGAVHEILQGNRRVVLVSHRPVSKVFARQRVLAGALGDRVRPPGRRPLHVALEVNKGKVLGREYTQRSRSFLFASLAAVTARMFGLKRVRFYENGVTSLNLPPSPQVLGSRASRTTHPRTLAGFERLFALLFGVPFEVDNPFRWTTKAAALRVLRATGHSDLCARTVSCAHTWEQTTAHPHCGRCSQCLDRRLTALAGGLTATEDDPARYRLDVLAGPRTGPDLILAERYVAMARRVDAMSGPDEFFREFPQTADVLPYTGLSADDGLDHVFRMYKEHAMEVLAALAGAVADLAPRYVRGQFPDASLLAIAGAQAPAASATRLDRAAAVLPNGADEGGLRIDHNRFTVWWRGRPCELGNRLEFALIVRLAQRPGAFVAIQTLADEVWNDELTEKSAIHRVASNLRRCLNKAGWVGVHVDGSQRGHYRLTGIDGAVDARTAPAGSAETQR
jgi:hypothetical protein